MTERMRCNQCRRRGFHGRFILNKNYTDYKRDPKCPDCSSTDLSSYKAISNRYHAKERKKNGGNCYCHEYSFPHQKGSMRFCVHNKLKLAGVEPTEDEMATYETVMETRRGE